MTDLPWAEVIGDPIAQSKSPIIHGFWLKKLGLEGRYDRTLVKADDLAGFFKDRRGRSDWRGCNVTMPHKIETAGLVDRLDPLAAKAGAVNTVVRDGDRLIGFNTDATGFLDLLDGEQPGHQAARFDLVGAGGAGRAVAAALAGRPMRIFNRTQASADALAGEFGGRGFGLEALKTGPGQGARVIIVNSSSLGMGSNPPLEIALHDYPPDTAVIDLVYHPLETPLLAQAHQLGLETVDGLALLIAQAARAFSIFFQADPPREHDAELRRLLLA